MTNFYIFRIRVFDGEQWWGRLDFAWQHELPEPLWAVSEYDADRVGRIISLQDQPFNKAEVARLEALGWRLTKLKAGEED